MRWNNSTAKKGCAKEDATMQPVSFLEKTTHLLVSISMVSSLWTNILQHHIYQYHSSFHIRVEFGLPILRWYALYQGALLCALLFTVPYHTTHCHHHDSFRFTCHILMPTLRHDFHKKLVPDLEIRSIQREVKNSGAANNWKCADCSYTYCTPHICSRGNIFL